MEYKAKKVEQMSFYGSSILKGMSTSISILDLLVREVFQNSLDAKNESKNHIVEKINIGEFDNEKLSNHFSEIKNKLFKYDNKFISIRDYNTYGLTGPVDINKASVDDLGRFLSLVQCVAKSNKFDDEGGSFGYGKTIYYKVGNGIVIYYSRIKLDNGQYESRLMACLVEDEKNEKGLLHDIQKGSNTGIAWWGKVENDKLLPITDEGKIKEILNIFELNPYIGEETGTCVIIPYIDEKYLLSTSTSLEDPELLPYWCKDISSYLDVAIQKWYPTKYDSDKGFHLYINEERKYQTQMLSIYKYFRMMYEIAFKTNSFPIKVNSFDININKYTLSDRSVGKLYYTLVKKKELLLGGYLTPETVINNGEQVDSSNKVILAFCRKPAMILKYDINEMWTGNVVCDNEDNYLLCFFIPNSSNLLNVNNEQFTVEDYLRACERQEHNNWTDIHIYEKKDSSKIDVSNLKLISKIQGKIRAQLNQLFTAKQNNNTSHIGSLLNKKLAKLFLPSTGFGKSTNVDKISKEKKIVLGSTKKSTIINGNIHVNSRGELYKDLVIKFSPTDSYIAYEFKIDTLQGPVSFKEWLELYNNPLEISKIVVSEVFKKNGESFKCNYIFNKNNIISDLSFNWILDENGNKYGFSFNNNSKKIVNIVCEIYYEIKDPKINLVLCRKKDNNE